MSLDRLPKYAALTFAAVSVALLPITAAFSQTPPASYTDLIENQSYVRECRQIIQGETAPVYDNTDLGSKPANQIGTLHSGNQVRLTGVMRRASTYTAVQVYLASGTLSGIQPVGWLDASKLTTCSTSSSQPPPAQKVCFHPNIDLTVRSGPSMTYSDTGLRFTPRSLIIPTTNPPTYQRSSNDGRVWLQVTTYLGSGWISSTGPNGNGQNLTTVTCP